ncbi:MAG: hypothetical protein AYK22_06890 [Thermoplasmatales archaeon SG8-52-3]|nr:MAG: hypothetical protein AYK22_06890 [Thermoplasmatales archaeon SG8-52-3]
MKKWGVILCIIILLFAGLSIPPALGSVVKTDEAEQGENISVYFWDCTGKRPIKQIIELTETEWDDLREQLREIRKTSVSFEESFNAQFEIFNQYGFNTCDSTYDMLDEIANERFKNKQFKQSKNPAPENIILNAICAINFEIDTGDTFVFGLNTFMNLVGLDIFSIHKGHTPTGVSTFGGLLAQSTEPGDYVGFMFGFLGYWAGTRTGTGTYTDLIVAGFTVMTTWFPLPNE